MGSLAYRSGALAFRSNKLGVNSSWVNMQCVNPQIKTGANGWTSSLTGFSNNVIYMDGTSDGVNWYSVIDRALDAYSNSSWVSSVDPAAVIQAVHGHGWFGPLNGYTSYDIKYENQLTVQDCAATFLKPAGVSAVSSARLWIGNAGEIFHTTIWGGRGNSQNWANYTVWLDRFTGSFGALEDYCTKGFPNHLAYLNNDWLEIVISTSQTDYYVIQLNRLQLAAMNAQRGNGIIPAGRGQNSFIFSGSIYLDLPAAVISMISNNPSVVVNMYWNWSDHILGPACYTCLHLADCFDADPNPYNYDSHNGWEERNKNCAAPWSVRLANARLLNLEVK